jgi:predicted dehydrogenase
MDQLGIGIVGCGNISTRYLANAPLFRNVAIRAVTDINPAAASTQAERFGVEAVPVAALLERPDIGAIVNLTVPGAHREVSLAALAAGKHVFSEKPLSVASSDGRRLVEEAERRDLLLGVAPDTILGPGQQLARRIIDEGRIGRIVAGTASLMSRGMEHWHPDPAFFYQPGGGPALDMGPYYITALVNLIGPVRRVVGMTARGLAERLVTAEGPRKGESIPVGTPTTAFAVLEFAQGALVTLGLSWDVTKHGHRPIELYGTQGSLRAPDPNFFAGAVELSEGGGEWQVIDSKGETLSRPNVPEAAPMHANYRMLGVADLAAAIGERRAPRASGRLGLHVLEVIDAVMEAAATGSAIHLAGGERPRPMSDAQRRALLVDPPSVTG